MTRYDGPLLNVQPAARKKAQFDVEAENETLFEAQDTLIKDNGKLPIYEIPLSFDSTNSPKLQRKVSTLIFFLESCLTLAKDHDALAETASILYQRE